MSLLSDISPNQGAGQVRKGGFSLPRDSGHLRLAKPREGGGPEDNLPQCLICRAVALNLFDTWDQFHGRGREVSE